MLINLYWINSYFRLLTNHCNFNKAEYVDWNDSRFKEVLCNNVDYRQVRNIWRRPAYSWSKVTKEYAVHKFSSSKGARNQEIRFHLNLASQCNLLSTYIFRFFFIFFMQKYTKKRKINVLQWQPVLNWSKARNMGFNIKTVNWQVKFGCFDSADFLGVEQIVYY